MPSLTEIQSIPGTIHVRMALHGRKALNVSVPTGDLIAHLARLEGLFKVTAANRQDPGTHRRVRSTLVMMVEELLDGKVAFEPASMPSFVAYGVTWCLLNHYRDAEPTRRAVARFLEEQGKVHLDLMTTANDQIALTASQGGEVEKLRDAVEATPHGSILGIALDDDGDPVVTANHRPSLH